MCLCKLKPGVLYLALCTCTHSSQLACTDGWLPACSRLAAAKLAFLPYDVAALETILAQRLDLAHSRELFHSMAPQLAARKVGFVLYGVMVFWSVSCCLSAV
jgi:hypothetical protein